MTERAEKILPKRTQLIGLFYLIMPYTEFCGIRGEKMEETNPFNRSANHRGKVAHSRASRLVADPL